MAQWSPFVKVLSGSHITNGEERNQNDTQIPYKVLEVTGLGWNWVEHQDTDEESETDANGELESAECCIQRRSTFSDQCLNAAYIRL